ncbi:hypothetical protein C900_04034 [Fulvivirga imtechensis AK7]|uniref:ABM domain-containing protein n=1 Tax=Fulvivirga imtechensis AK7 TaxID=1237149 RepID=L8JS89_9BACT|nr:hypothetical protein [Fulvivirga imtechensis]ELR70349.1 hypothetical protein C900_04034 [Fulvivirga imtechensis AK7]
MIARTWHGIVPISKKEAYYQYLQKTGLQDYSSIKGHLGLQVLQRDEQDVTHFFLITFWDSYESIKRFAGEQYEKARYYPEDHNFLLELEPMVQHFEVLEANQIVSINQRFKLTNYLKSNIGHIIGLAALIK